MLKHVVVLAALLAGVSAIVTLQEIVDGMNANEINVWRFYLMDMDPEATRLNNNKGIFNRYDCYMVYDNRRGDARVSDQIHYVTGKFCGRLTSGWSSVIAETVAHHFGTTTVEEEEGFESPEFKAMFPGLTYKSE